MKIEYVTSTYKNRWGDGHETHIIRVNGKDRVSQSDNIEPEDVQFYRDLSSPHDVSNIIEEIIAAVKVGEEIEIEWIDEDEK